MGGVWCAKDSKGRSAGWGKEREGMLAHDEVQAAVRTRSHRPKKRDFIPSTMGNY